jgi:hypothetical protein
MTIELKKFGEMLTSRPAGREAWLAAQAYLLDKEDKNGQVTVDFAGVAVLGPSWAAEFLLPLVTAQGQVAFINTDNPSVQATLELLDLVSAA